MMQYDIYGLKLCNSLLLCALNMWFFILKGPMFPFLGYPSVMSYPTMRYHFGV